MYFRYSIPRALRGLRTNWRANINTILILSASLAVVGMLVLLYINVIYFSEIWLSNTKVSLFLSPQISPEERDALLAQVQSHPLVRSAELVSPQDGLRNLAENLGADHELLSGAGIDGLPYTIDFDIVVDYRSHIGRLASRFQAMPGVEEVVYAERMLEQVRLFFLVLKGVGGFFVALILISFFLIIAHATKLSLYARRDEIEILSLVGATRRFIRSSFIVEGMLIALSGGLLAIALVWLCNQLLIAGLSWNEITRTIKEQSLFFPLRELGLALGVAALLGGTSSYFAVNRLLRELEP